MGLSAYTLLRKSQRVMPSLASFWDPKKIEYRVSRRCSSVHPLPRKSFSLAVRGKDFGDWKPGDQLQIVRSRDVEESHQERAFA